MRDLDLRMESDDEPTNAQPAAVAVTPELVSVPSARASAAPTTLADLSEAHEMLLRDMDEVRKVAQLVTERLSAMETRLAPSAAKQGEILERAAREALAETTREWSETAQRFRKFVDDMGTLAAFQERRLQNAGDPWKPLAAAALGALLAGLFVLWATGHRAAALRDWISGAPPAATEPAPAPAAPASAKKTVKPGTR